MNANMHIRLAARAAGVPMWKVARVLNVSEPTLYRWLREPFPDDISERMLAIIKDLGEKQTGITENLKEAQHNG